MLRNPRAAATRRLTRRSTPTRYSVASRRFRGRVTFDIGRHEIFWQMRESPRGVAGNGPAAFASLATGTPDLLPKLQAALFELWPAGEPGRRVQGA